MRKKTRCPLTVVSKQITDVRGKELICLYNICDCERKILQSIMITLDQPYEWGWGFNYLAQMNISKCNSYIKEKTGHTGRWSKVIYEPGACMYGADSLISTFLQLVQQIRVTNKSTGQTWQQCPIQGQIVDSWWSKTSERYFIKLIIAIW